ncbi:phosphopantetheine-binding protein [Sphaerisporangium album]|uniref:Phosphopantetheine-binding protein n=1 Tax=Sphaerisporangium album TaxID=509200 RepID=A0A367F9M2_9ACTN|nr:phosphopantetheine-binding protein [Sphaerisporangium album]RCG27068.1 phosphopantetheine-binding protein [Sphaerisporangium album]
MNEDVIFETVKRNVLEVLPDLEPDRVTMTGTLTDLGANSVDRADVVTMTMEDLGLVVPIAEFRDVHDIASLVDLLKRQA